MHKKTPPTFEPTGQLVGYARVSTADQSLEMQKAELRKAGVPEDNLWFEVKSGVTARRPQLEMAITQCMRGDTFVVYKLDRLGRSMLDLIEKVQDLTERGIGFRSLTEKIDTTTPGGRLLFHVLGALAQFERDLVVERTRSGMAAARARGVKLGAKSKLSDEDVKLAAAMLLQGKRPQEVADHFGVVRQTLYARKALKAIASRMKAKRKRERLKRLRKRR
jgi:DNA invertase Pin-like site-specific DNA recombinase